MPDHRITYTIWEKDGDEDLREVGFGASGDWETLEEALYEVESQIQNECWEEA